MALTWARRQDAQVLAPQEQTAVQRHLWLLPVYVWAVIAWSTYAIDISPAGRLDRSGHLKGHDFLHFYVLGEIARDRAPAELYRFDAHARRTDRLVPEYAHRFLPVHTPQVALAFSPLARLPYLRAVAVWLTVSAVLYLASVLLVARTVPVPGAPAWFVAGLALASPAFYSLIAAGQTSAVALACVTAAWFAMRSGRRVLTGVCLGALAYKPTFGLLLPIVWIAARDWRAIAGAAIAAGAEFALAAAYFGPGVLHAYVANFGVVARDLPLVEAQPWLMHSLHAFFALLVPWPAVASTLGWTASSSVAIGVASVWRRQAPAALRFSALSIGMVLVSPHLYGYDLVVLAPAMLLTVSWALARPRDGRALLWAVYAAFLLPAFDGPARGLHVQISVIALVLWLVLILRASLHAPARVIAATPTFVPRRHPVPAGTAADRRNELGSEEPNRGPLD